MTEARETVMNSEQWDRIYSDWLEFPGGTAGDLANKMNEEQAEISFPLGKAEGIKKAVEFIESYLVTTVHLEGNMHHIDDKEWQSVKLRLLR